MIPRQNLGEPATSVEFRRVFTEKFHNFAVETNLLAAGNAEYNDTWLDTLGKEGLAVSVSVIVGVIGLLGAISVLSAAVSAGIAIPVAAVGIIAGVAFYKTREHIKQKRYEHASEMLDRENLETEIDDMANMLANLYQVQLSNCTLKDAHVLAESCLDAITSNLLTNKKLDFTELLMPSSLQALLMRSSLSLPKSHLDMNIVTSRKFNTRGLVSHAAFYCKETDEFYRTGKSKIGKYGVLFFDKKSDLEAFESILRNTKRVGRKWELSKMRPHEVTTLKSSSMFKAYNQVKAQKEALEARPVNELRATV